jgi:hypothetical protein
MYPELAAALEHAAPRIGDSSYYVRMAVSYLIQHNILDETGYGLYACDPSDQGFMDHPITIDLTDGTVGEGEDWHTIQEFISYYSNTLQKV